MILWKIYLQFTNNPYDLSKYYQMGEKSVKNDLTKPPILLKAKVLWLRSRDLEKQGQCHRTFLIQNMDSYDKGEYAYQT